MTEAHAHDCGNVSLLSIPWGLMGVTGRAGLLCPSRNSGDKPAGGYHKMLTGM